MVERASGLEKTIGDTYNSLPKPVKGAVNCGLYAGAGAVLFGVLPVVTMGMGALAGVGFYGYRLYSKHHNKQAGYNKK